MAGQEQVQRNERTSGEAESSPTSSTPSPSAAERDAQVDSILDEIDAVLEENAEDFVKSFVQKGGQ